MYAEENLTEKIIGCAIRIHRELGPGMLESVYEQCLCREFQILHLLFEKQKPVPLSYRGVHLDCGFRLDLLVEKRVILELKCVESVQLVHRMQLLSYLRLCHLKVGLILNFYVPVMKDGIVRIIA